MKIFDTGDFAWKSENSDDTINLYWIRRLLILVVFELSILISIGVLVFVSMWIKR